MLALFILRCISTNLWYTLQVFMKACWICVNDEFQGKTYTETHVHAHAHGDIVTVLIFIILDLIFVKVFPRMLSGHFTCRLILFNLRQALIQTIMETFSFVVPG